MAAKKTTRYELDGNKFEVPNVGTFELHLEEHEPYVELVSPQDSLVWRILQAISGPDVQQTKPITATVNVPAEMIKATSSPDFLASICRADTPFVFSKGFEDLQKLHANVPNIAELSRTIEKLGEAKPCFVLGVGVKDDKDATMKVDVESALRGHEVDAHVVMMPCAAGSDKA
jgi:hypothetical protein